MNKLYITLNVIKFTQKLKSSICYKLNKSLNLKKALIINDLSISTDNNNLSF